MSLFFCFSQFCFAVVLLFLFHINIFKHILSGNFGLFFKKKIVLQFWVCFSHMMISDFGFFVYIFLSCISFWGQFFLFIFFCNNPFLFSIFFVVSFFLVLVVLFWNIFFLREEHERLVNQHESSNPQRNVTFDIPVWPRPLLGNHAVSMSKVTFLPHQAMLLSPICLQILCGRRLTFQLADNLRST